MSRCTAAGLAVLLPTLVAPLAGLALSSDGPTVKLWIDTGTDNPCEADKPASGGWMIRNNENRNVHIVLERLTTKDGATSEDQVRDTLGPRETRELGCEMSDDSHQKLTLVKVTF